MDGSGDDEGRHAGGGYTRRIRSKPQSEMTPQERAREKRTRLIVAIVAGVVFATAILALGGC